MNFSQHLENVMLQKNNVSCLGIDPHLDLLPDFLIHKYSEKYTEKNKIYAEVIKEYFGNILESVHSEIGIVKPQLAFFEQIGSHGIEAYEYLLHKSKEFGLVIISDAKRGDIGSTSRAYARAFLSDSSSWSSECLTINPYLGSDGIIPFAEEAEKNSRGLFVLLKTSNPSSSEIQDLMIGDKMLYEKVAQHILDWNKDMKNGFVGAVVGGTQSHVIEKVRTILPNHWFLIPGYGAQGASAKDLLHYKCDENLRTIVSASRSIIFAYKNDKKYSEKDYVEAAYAEVVRMKKDTAILI